MKRYDTKEIRKAAQELSAGEAILLNGTVYTARDAAHKRIAQLIEAGAPLPFELTDAVIYYAGPTPEKPGMVIGSCGPTTSSRMDLYSPMLLDLGLGAMIGKGERNEAVCEAIRRNRSLYFCAIGGAGALAAKSITSVQVIAFDDLGCESVKKLEFFDFPLITAIDAFGGNIFHKTG